jgi:hypothetical protein
VKIKLGDKIWYNDIKRLVAHYYSGDSDGQRCGFNFQSKYAVSGKVLPYKITAINSELLKELFI